MGLAHSERAETTLQFKSPQAWYIQHKKEELTRLVGESLEEQSLITPIWEQDIEAASFSYTGQSHEFLNTHTWSEGRICHSYEHLLEK